MLFVKRKKKKKADEQLKQPNIHPWKKATSSMYTYTITSIQACLNMHVNASKQKCTSYK